jgi:hypothetical protein
MAQRKAFIAGGLHDNDRIAMYQEEFKSNRGVTGPDSEKRRGVCFCLHDNCDFDANTLLQKAAPPRCCYSCNRAKTPE